MAERYKTKKFDNGKYGVVDENGKVVIEPKYDGIYELEGRFARVKIGEDYKIIDQTGKIIETQLPDSIK